MIPSPSGSSNPLSKTSRHPSPSESSSSLLGIPSPSVSASSPPSSSSRIPSLSSSESNLSATPSPSESIGVTEILATHEVSASPQANAGVDTFTLTNAPW